MADLLFLRLNCNSSVVVVVAASPATTTTTIIIMMKMMTMIQMTDTKSYLDSEWNYYISVKILYSGYSVQAPIILERYEVDQ